MNDEITNVNEEHLTYEGKKMLTGFAYTQIPLFVAYIYAGATLDIYKHMPLGFIHQAVIHACMSIPLEPIRKPRQNEAQ